MRIIAGEWRGRRLVAPTGEATRPTADRTRETLFSMLASRLGSFDGLRVADLFAGSGALGLEALSRGAAFACFVEQDREALRAIRANLEALGAIARAQLRPGSAQALPASAPFDLVLADPPYSVGSGSAVVRSVLGAGWLAGGGWLAIETARGEPVEPAGLALDAERDTGAARLTLLRRG
ncbi:16S rRNA (guanine(966)-N(2))-methyltransferase RsmD [Sphingomonas ginkgonis]|uniref:16S rRNA (Guanine(966)-N(2))-methyltransferase RsmD n=1 Tax=Sphingomonas ginkgonis TaxID=2315330 RepID=A0A3R9YM60_9SPHN|nr:16S rRNA (guanine(966)-N(2))-methyltransferase RsmD [Sphingomonas ginkgonis]RST30889.1 16S rRNA (guanine(966)-N(2))-methyltransferase RsmD [Sphingomonas ginkgonis]